MVESRLPRILAGVAASVLIATAIFHATGYPAIADGISATTLSPFFRRALPGIWLFFSWHLLALAFGLGWASISGSGSARPLVWFVAVVVCVDTLFVYSSAGFFAGTLLLFLAAVSLLIAALKWHGA
jgi:hypothetical protein